VRFVNCGLRLSTPIAGFSIAACGFLLRIFLCRFKLHATQMEAGGVVAGSQMRQRLPERDCPALDRPAAQEIFLGCSKSTAVAVLRRIYGGCQWSRTFARTHTRNPT
jgi:hypothetical protein